jgi:hypothetical protein
MAAGLLVIAAAAFGTGYLVSLRLWPETRCGRCEGSGRNAGSTSKRFGRCRSCAGSGRKPRLGTRIISRGRDLPAAIIRQALPGTAGDATTEKE